MKLWTLFLLVATSCTASLLGATDYYVANAGSNANNGLSSAAPLLTITYAQTNHCGPGNRILLHRGDVISGSDQSLPVAAPPATSCSTIPMA